MIEFDVRSYRYPNGVVGLENFRETFEGCEFVIGATGSGKSTVLRMMNGLIPEFYSGRLDGKVRVFGRKPSPRDVFLVKQNPQEMVTCLNVIDEVIFPAVQRGDSVVESKTNALETLEEVGIGHLLDRKTFELSTGELQLVEIAAAIVAGAKILVFDEPFAHLSHRNAKRVLSVLKDFSHIVSEHRLEFGKYFDRVVDLGLEVEEIEIPKAEIGDTIYSGIVELREREILAITGDNGVGKTMMLKRIMADMRRKGMNAAIVLQYPSYHLTERTVEKEVGNILGDFELVGVATRHPQSLSIGQMRRVAIAKAFNSDILLLDEPTAGQDVNFRRRLLYLLRKYRKTAIIATHDENLAKECDRVIEL